MATVLLHQTIPRPTPERKHPEWLTRRMVTTGAPDPATLTGFAIAQQHPATTGWVTRDCRIALLADEVADLLVLAEDEETAVRRRDRFAPHEAPEIFLDRWVELASGLGAFLGIRHEGGDATRPFVEAWVLSHAVRSDEDLSALVTAAQELFGRLAPSYLRFWSADPAGHWPGSVADKRFLAAPVDELRPRPMPSGLDVVPARDLRHYDEAVAAYAAVDDQHPEHPNQARIEPRNVLAGTLADGLLFDVLLDDTWVGYVGADERSRLGLPGHTVRELIMTPTARGRGLGPGLTTGLARGVPGDGILLGTIHHDNRGARLAALAAGRVDVGGWSQVPLSLA